MIKIIFLLIAMTSAAVLAFPMDTEAETSFDDSANVADTEPEFETIDLDDKEPLIDSDVEDEGRGGRGGRRGRGSGLRRNINDFEDSDVEDEGRGGRGGRRGRGPGLRRNMF